MQRKDDHIQYALLQEDQPNDFDKVRCIACSIPSISFNDVSLNTTYFNQTFELPIYINAMTGGSDKAKVINEKLAYIAAHLNIPIACGSVSAALKHPLTKESYTVLRKHNPKGFIISNIGISADPKLAQLAVELLNANALQVHINAPQEIAMPEGDRDFTLWSNHLKTITQLSDVPVIAKEVGFGMTCETLELIKSLGIHTVDISGRGGTNFIKIENLRSKHPLSAFEGYGLSTVESLLEAKKVKGLTILASGGIRNPYDVIKALALGAQAVGLSGYFLKLVTQFPKEEALEITKDFIIDIKKIMTVLNAKDIDSLRKTVMIFDEQLISFMKQRNITITS